MTQRVTDGHITMKNKIFQPGTILHEVIDGAFRSQGTTFSKWCVENGVHYSTARNATHGQSAGDAGEKLRKKIIKAAGYDVVLITYRKRMTMEAAKLDEVAA